MLKECYNVNESLCGYEQMGLVNTEAEFHSDSGGVYIIADTLVLETESNFLGKGESVVSKKINVRTKHYVYQREKSVWSSPRNAFVNFLFPC